MIFTDRVDAGRRLATCLTHLHGEDVVVLGLPRGGVPVAAAVARALKAPLDVIVVRKLGVPVQPELGMGAIGEDGIRIVNHDVVRRARVSQEDLAAVEQRERAELHRRARRFRGDKTRVDLTGRTAVIVDDGIATGSTARAACEVARAHGARRVVLAVPVAPEGWTERFAGEVDELIAVQTPSDFWAIGHFYDDFSQTSDDDVVACLEADTKGRDEEIQVQAGTATVSGHLTLPANASGVVIFAHGSGSSRHSPRNRYVASVLSGAGLGTVLFDLLTAQEERDRANVFDITLLARRLLDITGWLRREIGASGLTIGYFGASTGAAAALTAAAEPEPDVAAVVSRGGRPDLAGERLGDVKAPTLLVVGGDDDVVLDLNRQAQAQLRCDNELAIVDGATHLFEEPGTLEHAAELARDWFIKHLQRGT